MEKMLIITPHLSTGGLPQFLLKKIEVLINKWDIYLIEWENITGGNLVVQRNKIENLLKNKLITLDVDKSDVINLIEDINPKVIHFEEFPETFISIDILDTIFIDLKDKYNFFITETTHGTQFDSKNKKFIADKTMFVSNYNYMQYDEISNLNEIIKMDTNKKLDRDKKLIELGLDPNYKHVMNVGLFNRNKNQSEIFEYATMMLKHKVVFHFFGNMAGNFEDYWKPLIENKPGNCKIWGERDDVYKFYSSMDLFLFTSKLENRPLSVIEAISYEMPILMYNLETYAGDFSKFENVSFLTNDTRSNINMIKNILNIDNVSNKSENKISAYHILTDVDSDREVRSVISLTQLKRRGIEYNSCVNKRWTDLPPHESCEYPEKISMEPGGNLTPGHYGCYLGHKDAFYRGFESDSDFIFIFECDAVIDVDMNDFMEKVNLACDVLNKKDMLMFSFGFHNNTDIIEKNNDYWVVNKFYGAHAYLIPRKSFDIIDKMYRNSKWNVTDLLFVENLNQYKMAIFKNPPTKQAGGISILDKVEHEDRY